MRRRFSGIQKRELAFVLLPLLLLIGAAFWWAAQFLAPAPPTRISLAAATKGSPYYEAAQRYRAVLADNGITLDVRETNGSVENAALIKDAASNVSVAFLQGGLTNGKELPEVLSIGRVFHEPVWIFYQGSTRLERLTQLAGKRVLIGPAQSATAALATRLLAASGITNATATLINMELPDYVETLENDRADAGILVLMPEARTIRRLFDSPKVRLMSTVQADAYVQRFPFLSRLDLKEGVVNFARNIPETDTAMLTTTAAVVVRQDTHPALVNLLTQALITTHSNPRLDTSGEVGLFQRAGAFPIAEDQEFPLSADAARVYKSGPPFLQRYLPFWFATLVDRLIVLALPAIGVLVPAVRFAPVLYAWRVRRRIIHWYRVLKRIEADVGDRPSAARIAEAAAEIDRVEDAVNRLPIPLGFANQLYDLREHIDVVRRRLQTLRPST
jgi:uncharacterized protein